MNRLPVRKPSRTAVSVLVVVTLAVSAQPVAATVGWAVSGSMTVARYGHSATLLHDGTVLVAGGVDGGGYVTPSAELFDAATGAWRTSGDMTSGLFRHTAARLSNGDILVAGGLDGAGHVASTAQIYDRATGRWRSVARMQTERYQHVMVALLDGRVMVAGGDSYTGVQATTEIYDPATDLWSPAGQMATRRLAFAAALLPDGRVLAAGGFEEGAGPVASAEVFDPATGRWSAAGSLSQARAYHTATALESGDVLVAGGSGLDGSSLSSAEVYEPSTGIWSPTGSLLHGRSFHTASMLSDGTVLVAGGNGGGDILASAELFDPTAGSWTATASMTAERYLGTATVLEDGRVLAAGGSTSSGNTSTAELYDPAGDSRVPTTTITLDPPTANGSNGWYRTGVHVAVSTTDPNGVTETRCVLDPATPPVSFDALPTGCPFSETGASVSSDGEHVLYAASKDRAGNKEILVRQAFKIDRTAPSVRCGAGPTPLWPPNHQLVGITAAVAVTDTGGSGPDGFSLEAVSSSQSERGLAGDDVFPDTQGWSSGSADTGGLLRAERYGSARSYSIIYQGADKAGNATSCTATVTVPLGRPASTR